MPATQRKVQVKHEVDDFIATAVNGQPCHWLPNAKANEWHEASFTLDAECSVMTVCLPNGEIVSVQLMRTIFVQNDLSQAQIRPQEVSAAVKQAEREKRLVYMP